MKKLKKLWLGRGSPLWSAFLIYVVILFVGYFLAILINPFFFLLMFLSLVLFFYRYQYIRYIKEWSWVCIKCGKKQIGERKKYCQICGGEMILKKD